MNQTGQITHELLVSAQGAPVAFESEGSSTGLLSPDSDTELNEGWSEYVEWTPTCAAGDDLDDDEAYFLDDGEDDDEDEDDEYDEDYEDDDDDESDMDEDSNDEDDDEEL